SFRRDVVPLTNLVYIRTLDIPDDVPAIVQLGTHGRRDGIGFRHVIHVPRAVYGDAVVHVLKGVVDPQVSPLGPNPSDTVHDVSQAEHELRRGGLLLQRVQAFPKLPFPTEGFMVDQHEVRDQRERSLSQDSGSDVDPEMIDGRLMFRFRLDHRGRAHSPGQLQVVATFREGELPDHRDPGQPVEIDPTATRWRGSQIARGPLRQRLRGQGARMQHVNQTEVAEALGADPLLGFGFYPRHDQGVFLKREGLTYRVVAS